MVEIIVHFPIILTNIDKTFFFVVRPLTNYFVLNIRCKEGIYTWKKIKTLVTLQYIQIQLLQYYK